MCSKVSMKLISFNRLIVILFFILDFFDIYRGRGRGRLEDFCVSGHRNTLVLSLKRDMGAF